MEDFTFAIPSIDKAYGRLEMAKIHLQSALDELTTPFGSSSLPDAAEDCLIDIHGEINALRARIERAQTVLESEVA